MIGGVLVIIAVAFLILRAQIATSRRREWTILADYMNRNGFPSTTPEALRLIGPSKMTPDELTDLVRQIDAGPKLNNWPVEGFIRGRLMR